LDRETYVSRPDGRDWETPAFEEIRVSAEATGYMGVKEEWD
jgi:coenzyme PQQ precursor peptide PqqA